MTDKDLRLEAGSVVALRFYDLGRTVDVDSLARRASGDVERPQFPAGAGVRYGRAPVEIALDDVEVPVEDGRLFADASLRVFDFGIAVLALRVLVGGLDWDRFTERVDEIGGAVAGRAQPWSDAEQRARDALRRARLALGGEPVGHHVFVVARRFSNALPLDQLVDGEYAASIVSRDWLPLTSIARSDLLRGARISGRDLIVAGDARSLVVEAAPGSGVPDVVEAALAQRACYDAASGPRAGDRVSRAAALLSSQRDGRLATLLGTARARYGVAEAEASALRGGGKARASVPWAGIVVVAALTAVITTILVLALG